MSWVFLGLVNLFLSRLFGAAARRAAAARSREGAGSRRAGGAGR
jgi:hypothetical protein